MPGTSNKEELIRQLAHKIEKQLRDIILKGPHPSLTTLSAFCTCCLEIHDRREMRLIKIDGDELLFCLGCIQKRGLKESDSIKALEYQARTMAILRIKGISE